MVLGYYITGLIAVIFSLYSGVLYSHLIIEIIRELPMGKKQIRENFRNTVFERDGHKCLVCNRSDVKLDAHHIIDRHEMPNGGYVK